MCIKAGQERFRTITSSYYRGAHGILTFYDVTNKKSFENVKDWLNEQQKYASPSAVKWLVGSKIDDVDNRKVTEEEAKELAEEEKKELIEISAKNGENVEKMFLGISKAIMDSSQMQDSAKLAQDTKDVRFSLDEEEPKSRCC